MDELLKGDLLNRFKELPPEIQKVLLSTDLSKSLEEVVNRNKLMIDQAGTLESETLLILLGVEPLDKFIDNLTKNLGVSREKAVILAHDIDELIFKNMREALKKVDALAKVSEETNESISKPNKESVLAGIENPGTIAESEGSVSLSSLKSNSTTPEYPHETLTKGVEIKRETSMEIPPETRLIMKKVPESQALIIEKPAQPFHENISPVKNIVEERVSGTISSPREKIVIEETSKLPEKPIATPASPSKSKDPYRESLE
jgi:hypothetical protein